MSQSHAQSAETAILNPPVHLNLLRGSVSGGVILPALITNKRYSVLKHRNASLEPAGASVVADYETSVKNNEKVKTAQWIEVTVRDLKMGSKIVCKCVAPKTRIRDFRKEMFSICGLSQKTDAGCGILRMVSEHSFRTNKDVQATAASVHGNDSNASISSERESENDSDWGWQEGKSDTDGGEDLSRCWSSPSDEATLAEAWEMIRRKNLQQQTKEESREGASKLATAVLTLASLGAIPRRQRTVSSGGSILQKAKLKPHRTRTKVKSCPVGPKGKHHTGSPKNAGTAEVEKDDDGDTVETQRRKILLLWEYSTLDDDHENLLTLARHCELLATQTLDAHAISSEGKRGGCSTFAAADEDAVKDLNHRRYEGCLDSNGSSMDHRHGGTAGDFATWQPSTRSIKQAKVKQLSIEVEPDRRAMLAQDMALWKGLGLMNGRVYKLNLSGCQPPLQGDGIIGPEIGLLAELERINFNNNKISGPLPLVECLGRLTRLRQLSISNNQISGSLKNISVLKHLTNLELSRNAITGSIPPELGSLDQLVSLNLSHNKLTGMMPSEMSGLSTLRVLNLSHNKLHGWLKSWVGTLPYLQRIDLGYNKLEGSLPMALTRLGGLEYLHLPHNELRGGLPMDVLTCLNLEIREIFLQGNLLYASPKAVDSAEISETAAMIKANKCILEAKYCHCNAIF